MLRAASPAGRQGASRVPELAARLLSPASRLRDDPTRGARLQPAAPQPAPRARLPAGVTCGARV